MDAGFKVASLTKWQNVYFAATNLPQLRLWSFVVIANRETSVRGEMFVVPTEQVGWKCQIHHKVTQRN